MKTFRYKLGHEAGKTMTVAELKAELDKYPDGMPVLATWEGIHTFFSPDCFEIKEWSAGNEEDREKCLVIDVDQYSGT
jgi:hypothetical protein